MGVVHENNNDSEQIIESEPIKVDIRTGIDDSGHLVHRACTTIDEVSEEHIYIIYRSTTKDIVIEADLLGDQATVGSDGKLPPVIHIECPRCTSPEDRRALSITYENKKFEIEDLEEKDWGGISHPAGGMVMGTDGNPAIVKRRLTIKETFCCTYCNSSFRLTDNIMSDA
jgi:hypothetical protein